MVQSVALKRPQGGVRGGCFKFRSLSLALVHGACASPWVLWPQWLLCSRSIVWEPPALLQKPCHMGHPLKAPVHAPGADGQTHSRRAPSEAGHRACGQGCASPLLLLRLIVCLLSL